MKDSYLTSSFFTAWARQLRLHQWVKNLLIFAPLLAAHQEGDQGRIWKLLIAFLGFSLTASGIYLINDLIDLSSDQSHPVNRFRPIASGVISKKQGILASFVLLISSTIVGYQISSVFDAWLIGYIILTFSYTFYFKRVEILDIIVLTLFYLIRIAAGASASGTSLSFWLLAFSIFFFLSLSFLKRFGELRCYEMAELKPSTRRAYTGADSLFLEIMGITSGYSALVVLALYLNSDVVQNLYIYPKIVWILVPIVAFWISWMWLEAHRGNLYQDPIIFAVQRTESILAGIAFVGVLVFSTVRIG